jgi:hypothetical protein
VDGVLVAAGPAVGVPPPTSQAASNMLEITITATMLNHFLDLVIYFPP